MERKLAEKIAAYRSNYFELLPLKNRMMESDNHFTLAAASAHTLQKKLITQTFLNADSSFLLRLVESEKESLLYVFTRDTLADYSLKLTFFVTL